jgi:folate-binding protein YgfZ
LYRLIKVSGRDATQFLQGQLTQDVELLKSATGLAAAWCNPQGRVIVTMRLISMPDAIGLVIPQDIADEVCGRLLRYRLRSQVHIVADAEEWHCAAVSSPALDSAPAPWESLQSGDVVMSGLSSDPPVTELYGPQAAVLSLAPEANTARIDCARAQIQAGIPRIGMKNSEKYTPHMLNLDRIGAISFSKGCYTGQEIIARTQHLGASKRRLMRYRCNAKSIAIGNAIQRQNETVGEVVNVAGKDLLAVTPVALHAETLVLNGAVATPVALAYPITNDRIV